MGLWYVAQFLDLGVLKTHHYSVKLVIAAQIRKIHGRYAYLPPCVMCEPAGETCLVIVKEFTSISLLEIYQEHLVRNRED